MTNKKVISKIEPQKCQIDARYPDIADDIYL